MPVPHLLAREISELSSAGAGRPLLLICAPGGGWAEASCQCGGTTRPPSCRVTSCEPLDFSGLASSSS